MEPTEGDTDHVTPTFDVPLTVAVNCCVPPDASVAVVGDMATPTVVAGATLMAAVFVTELNDAVT